MNENERVNHPSHYEKGNGHTECIYLLSILTERYSGIYAGCVMQAKYLYRAGSKAEEGIGAKEKAIEDVKKFQFYWGKIRENQIDCLEKMKPRFNPLMEEVLIKKLVEEFTFDKPDWEIPFYRDIIENIITAHNIDQFINVANDIELLIKELSKTLD